MVIRQWIERTGLSPDFYTAFEPNKSHVKELVETVSSLGLKHDILAQPFTLEAQLTQDYDIALFSHSLYWMPDPAEHMLHAASSLVGGGLALAFTGGPYAVHAMFPL
jgi:SAM-dependent methyltransferase